MNILTLRKSQKLRNKVTKKLKRSGLIHSDECRSLSESISSDGSQKSDVQNQGSSKRKPKRNKSKDSSSDSLSGVSFSSSESDSDEKKRKRKIKSGIKGKASDSVRKSLRYPQAHLRFEFVSSNVSFEKLDINLFVAGETEIISDKCTKEMERKGRLDLLKKIMYLPHMNFPS